MALGQQSGNRLTPLIFDNLEWVRSCIQDDFSAKPFGGLASEEILNTRALEENIVILIRRLCSVGLEWQLFFLLQGGNTERGREKCGQARKGVWGMSWHQKA